MLRIEPPATTFVAPGQQALDFTAGFDGTPSVRAVAYRDPSEYEQYLRVDGAARAEAIYSLANGRQTALEFSPYALRSLTRGWRFNAVRGNAEVIENWGETRLFRDDGRTLRYALYEHRGDAGRRGCLAFSRAWDSVVDDPRHRPARTLFGYYCSAPGEGLTGAQAWAVLRGLVIRMGDVPRVYYGGSRERDPAALAYARGRAQDETGHPDFPLRQSRYYNVGDGDDSFN
ncbi:hypothetical protein [Salinisphaera aquimarina]|uniref:Uncharacterized protein n=1 Tax=Salinisphaera aquimarina TaxID=2094031 RepID=A0ABV7EKA9_9GAMM